MFLSIWPMQNWHIILSFNAVMGLSRVTRIRWKERITIERERIKEITERQAFLACDSLASPSSPSYLWHHVEAYSVKFAATEKEVLSWAVIWSNLTVSYLELHSTCHNLIHSSSKEVCLYACSSRVHSQTKFAALDCHRGNCLAPHRNISESLCKTVPRPHLPFNSEMRSVGRVSSFGSVLVRQPPQKNSYFTRALKRSVQASIIYTWSSKLNNNRNCPLPT